MKCTCGSRKKKSPAYNNYMRITGTFKDMHCRSDFRWVNSPFLGRWFWLFSVWTRSFKPVAGIKGFNLGFEPTFGGKGLIACFPYFIIQPLLLFPNILNSFSDFTYSSEVKSAQRGSTFNWFDGDSARAHFPTWNVTSSDKCTSYSFRLTYPYFEKQINSNVWDWFRYRF